MFKEDNSGFVFFPFGNRIMVNQGDKTLIYLVAFDPKKNQLSNITICNPGSLVSDDVTDSPNFVNRADFELKFLYDKIYFPNIESEDDLKKTLSMSFISAVCIGWSNDSYEFKNGLPWKATYRDLTEEGKKLYYSIKKLHNSKEVRILTFNNI
jgi:hypothetical protein